MSNLVSALNGKSENGVQECGLRGMITLRGDLSDVTLRKTCLQITGVEVPETRRVNMSGDRGLAWMSPDELLILLPYGDVADALTQIETGLAGTHFMAENVSDARAMFTIAPDIARDTIARLSPVDMSNDSFSSGDFRRTRIAQVAAAFWMSDTGMVQVICFRSVAQYVFGTLSNAAKSGPVGHF
ncbi:sarcosine oxidase subunit gamma [Aestuariibius sp. HNIBRBA575]|uniref:sarcosine oxidase subunit gamma n=1 Tax=Aestuariibius sp. HNIBRBA575 TaxID=3233343 RepID=UPI0034A34B58